MSSARKPKATSRADTDPDTAYASPAAPPLPVDRDDLAYYVRHHLSRTERLIIMLRYAEELDFDEIAGILKMPQAEVEEIHKLIVGRLKSSLMPCEALAGV